MASSRIFIKGLPPSITEADFKKHFSSGGREVTDARLFANRRIGYVGYKTPEDAQSAVKYFNKTFVRMSRIVIEVARPIGESNPGRPSGRAPIAARENHEAPITAPNAQNNSNAEPSTEEDPKLKEYLEVMKPKSKKRTWENDNALLKSQDDPTPADHHMAVDAGASDDEYEEVPRKNKRTKVDPSPNEQAQVEATSAEVAVPSTNQVEETAQDNAAAGNAAVSDADWARSRTSRLLGLLDDDEEEEEEAGRPKARAASVSSSEMEDAAPSKAGPTRTPTTATEPVPAPPPVDPTQPDTETEPTGVRASMRLFVRNLPYGVQEDDLQAEFAPYGNLEEVSILPPSHPFLFKMST
jgi:multiple RNA-binding domain-containing protein 1